MVRVQTTHLLSVFVHVCLKAMCSAGLATGYFESVHIIPYTQKDTTHFPKIRADTGVPFQKMLFYDDEAGNISRVRGLSHKAPVRKVSAG